mmetsp:Transcript_14427/g.31273  ORF Transcript_14427/g.31273 Transcript_14427/m.31273 type:complete len:778 (-) Transcript_14427:251-2584(-)
MEVNEDSIPEPILRLRKTSVLRNLHSFDHSGEDMSRKRLHADAMGANDGNNDDNNAENEELKEQVSKMMHHDLDPPARERPADDNWPHRESLSFTRSLIFYGSGSITPEHETAAKNIEEARTLRKKYHGGRGVQCSLEKKKTITFEDANAKEDADTTATNDGENVDNLKPSASEQNESLPTTEQPSTNGKTSQRLEYVFGTNGIVEVYEATDFRRTNNLVTVPPLTSFVADYQRLVEMVSSGAMRSFSFQRLQMLTSAFKMHVTINGTAEDEAQSGLLGTDFYRTMKVDNHIHLAAAASAKQFVNFVRDKLENEGDTVVMEDGLTLKEVFKEAGLDSDHLTIDAFNVLADYSVYQRFDNFNGKYSPFRMAQMRKIFLKSDNKIDGRYFAELTKIVLARHEQGKGHCSAAEMRLSIYGMESNEWEKLAKWVLRDWEGGDFPGNMISSHNRWLIQVPRLWRIYYQKGKGKFAFQDMLENLFSPLFEATLHPEEHPEVAEFLNHIVGFDSVDDEGSMEAPLSCCQPASWKKEDNPAYCWQLYFFWANMEILNKVRASRGLNTFAFRPHAGETGETMHLAATYMLCRSINHGINLDKQVSLQYLYYLDQVGLSISPLSNNFLFRKMRQNPFPKLFTRGLNVTLSTDDPLLFHLSDDALLEEYSVARASFDLSMTDMSELARNSVYQSGFENHFKEKWLGKHYKRGVTHCDENKTHVPLIRAKFRAEHLALEHLMVILLAAGKGKTVLQEMMHQFGDARNGQRRMLLENMTEVPDFPEHNQL